MALYSLFRRCVAGSAHAMVLIMISVRVEYSGAVISLVDTFSFRQLAVFARVPLP